MASSRRTVGRFPVVTIRRAFDSSNTVARRPGGTGNAASSAGRFQAEYGLHPPGGQPLLSDHTAVRGRATAQAGGWEMPATVACTAWTRSPGAISISSPRRPPLQKMVPNPSAEESITTGSRLRCPSGEMPPTT